jgi:hypothetical protein
MKILLCFLAMVLVLGTAQAHDLFPSHPELSVEAFAPGRWIGDNIKLVFWVLGTVFVYPLGLLFSLLGQPQIYDRMYDKLVTGVFALSSHKKIKATL